MGFALWTIRSAQRSSLGPRCVTASDHRVTVTTTHFPIGGLRDSGKLIICLCINISINTIYIYIFFTVQEIYITRDIILSKYGLIAEPKQASQGHELGPS